MTTVSRRVMTGVLSLVLATSGLLFGAQSASAATAQSICGSGYYIQETASISGEATAYLLYSNSTGKNCAVTIKNNHIGTPTSTYAKIRSSTTSWVTNSGNFSYYAGPVYVYAPHVCVSYGGGTMYYPVGFPPYMVTYESFFIHCG
jgi:hypothetical protein